MEKIGSEIAPRQVPARPVCPAGSYLHAKLAWHLGTVYHVPGIFFIEARSLDSNAPTWNKQSSELLPATRAAYMYSGEELCMGALTQNIFECASSVEFLRVITRM